MYILINNIIYKEEGEKRNITGPQSRDQNKILRGWGEKSHERMVEG